MVTPPGCGPRGSGTNSSTVTVPVTQGTRDDVPTWSGTFAGALPPPGSEGHAGAVSDVEREPRRSGSRFAASVALLVATVAVLGGAAYLQRTFDDTWLVDLLLLSTVHPVGHRHWLAHRASPARQPDRTVAVAPRLPRRAGLRHRPLRDVRRVGAPRTTTGRRLGGADLEQLLAAALHLRRDDPLPLSGRPAVLALVAPLRADQPLLVSRLLRRRDVRHQDVPVTRSSARGADAIPRFVARPPHRLGAGDHGPPGRRRASPPGPGSGPRPAALRLQLLWFTWAGVSIPGALALCWLDQAVFGSTGGSPASPSAARAHYLVVDRHRDPALPALRHRARPEPVTRLRDVGRRARPDLRGGRLRPRLADRQPRRRRPGRRRHDGDRRGTVAVAECAAGPSAGCTAIAPTPTAP